MLDALLAAVFGTSHAVDQTAYARHRESFADQQARLQRVVDAELERLAKIETERCVAKVLGRMVPATPRNFRTVEPTPYLSPAEREFLDGSHAGRH